MPSVLGSIPSFRTPFVLMPQSFGESRQLPAMLADQGYATAFFCGSERGSMGFGAYARSAGVERLVSREDYEGTARHGDFDGYWGIWDEEFLQFLGEELDDARTLLRPLFTLSSHHPVVVPEALRRDAARGLHPHPQGRGLRRCGLPPLLPPLRPRGVVPPHDLRLRGRPCLLGEIREETREYPGNMHIIGFIYTPDGALRG